LWGEPVLGLGTMFQPQPAKLNGAFSSFAVLKPRLLRRKFEISQTEEDEDSTCSGERQFLYGISTTNEHVFLLAWSAWERSVMV